MRSVGEEVQGLAHGRVNLIGEHTDYNDGWVLPTLIPQRTQVALQRRSDNQVIGRSSFEKGRGLTEESYKLGEERPSRHWLDYVKGATKILREEGHEITGFDLVVDSNVPIGSGLSSSAALEVSLLKALRELFHLRLEEVEIAKIGQRIENEFVGARVGIMDQMACALARAGEALFLDTAELRYERIPIPLEEVDLIVIHSGISHELSQGDGGYNERRAQCEKACNLLGVKSLREITDPAKVETLPDPYRRRARHVVTENRRVHEAVKALKERNFSHIGKLFYESHTSMRDDYQVSLKEIDQLVELCREEPNVYGARLTGGGFGGSIVALAEKGSAQAIALRVAGRYHLSTGRKATIVVPENVGGET